MKKDKDIEENKFKKFNNMIQKPMFKVMLVAVIWMIAIPVVIFNQ